MTLPPYLLTVLFRVFQNIDDNIMYIYTFSSISDLEERVHPQKYGHHTY